MLVEAIKRHGYGGMMRSQGTQYFIDNPKHVKLLSATKRIRIISPGSAEKKVDSKTQSKVKQVVSQTNSKIKIPKINTANKVENNKIVKVNKRKKAIKPRESKHKRYSRKDMMPEENKES